jgi:hypothetical protein
MAINGEMIAATLEFRAPAMARTTNVKMDAVYVMSKRNRMWRRNRCVEAYIEAQWSRRSGPKKKSRISGAV